MVKLTYNYDSIDRISGLLNALSVSGISNFRILAEVVSLLESGEVTEETEEMTIKHKRGTPPKEKE